MKNNKASLALTTLLTLTLTAFSAPKVLTQYFPVNKFVKGSEGMVFPPEEIQKYVKIVEKAALADTEWFKTYSAQFSLGIPLPYHEKMGLSQSEYNEYMKLWNEREFVERQPMALKLEKAADGDWMIRTTGPGYAISTLRFNEEKNEFSSPNGKFKQVEDIHAVPLELLGAWTGQEWVHESETTISKTTENIAIGRINNENLGYLIYRIVESSSAGRVLYDNSLLIKFPINH